MVIFYTKKNFLKEIFFWPYLWHMENGNSWARELNPSCICELYPSCGNARSLTYCARAETPSLRGLFKINFGNRANTKPRIGLLCHLLLVNNQLICAAVWCQPQMHLGILTGQSVVPCSMWGMTRPKFYFSWHSFSGRFGKSSTCLSLLSSVPRPLSLKTEKLWTKRLGTVQEYTLK